MPGIISSQLGRLVLSFVSRTKRFMEALSDRQAADAVRARIDWKSALGLKLSDPGFDWLTGFSARSLPVASNDQS